MEKTTSTIAKDVNNLVQEYVSIEEDIFKFSFRKSIPIPGIFKPVDYGKHQERLQEMGKELEILEDNINSLKKRSKKDEESFLLTLRAYVRIFIKAVEQLQNISLKLKQQSEGNRYPKVEYKKDAVTLRTIEKEYFEIGRKLNSLYRQL